MAISRIGVVGAGAWGLALAIVAGRAGRAVRLWGRQSAALAELAATRSSPRLPGVVLPPAIELVGALAELRTCDALLLAAPAQATRAAAQDLAAALSVRPPLVICAKGVETATGRFLTEIVAETAPGFPLGVLSGPSFAVDVAAGLPTAVTLAAADGGLAAALADALQGPNLRLYDSDDPRGVEIGGAAKNVLAIACGAAAGLKLGAERQRGAGGARLRRARPLRRRLWRAPGDADGPFRSRRSRADLRLAAIAQFRLRLRPRPRSGPDASRRRQTRRRGVHRARDR